MNYPIIKQIEDTDLPLNAGMLSRLPLYLNRDIVADLPH